MTDSGLVFLVLLLIPLLAIPALFGLLVAGTILFIGVGMILMMIGVEPTDAFFASAIAVFIIMVSAAIRAFIDNRGVSRGQRSRRR
ncbi:MAG: hypothetical protein KIT81_00585 [Alphaproteobacteria bacterium]|nr:hypothetical protein [Alphaproteobacteria bacterium]